MFSKRINKELTNYVAECRAANLSDDEIRNNLLAEGWDENFVTEGLAGTKALGARKGSSIFVKLYAKKIVLGIALAVVLVLAGGGYFAYAKFFAATPEKIWSAVLKNSQSISSEHFIYEINLSTDLGKIDLEDLGGQLPGYTGCEIAVWLKTEGDQVKKSDTQADLQMKGSAGIKAGSFNANYDGELRLVNNKMFFKSPGRPLEKLFGINDAAKEWIMMDLQTLRERTGASESQSLQPFQDIEKLKFLKRGADLGTEIIDGQKMQEYEVMIDKAELKNFLEQIMTDSMGNNSSLTAIPGSINQILDSIDFKKLQIWVGKSDRQVHQLEIQIEIKNVFTEALTSSRLKARDANRLTDIRQIMTALELQYDDHGSYPTATSGMPLIDKNIIGIMPNAPKPADGNCTEKENLYWYEQLEGGKSYSLKFCVGESVGGVGPGIVEASPTGLKKIGPGSNKVEAKAAPKPIMFEFKANFSKFNEPVQIEEPQNAYNLLGEYQRRDVDAQELANIRQIMVGLELYYNDKSRYPQSLQDLSEYLNPKPSPKNTLEICSGIDPNFNYAPGADGIDYSMDFCLFEGLAGLSSGKHKASPSGLK